jgi:hypothetical protein
MRKSKVLIFAILLCAVFTGCATQPPDTRRELLASQNLFLSTVNTLTILRDSDKLNEDDLPRIKALINSGHTLLDQWTQDVLDGKPTNAADAFEVILEQLIEYQEAADG